MQTDFEAFWNPLTSELALNCPGMEIDVEAQPLEFAVFASAIGGKGELLVAVIQQQRESYWTVVRLPHDHRYVVVLPSASQRAARSSFLLIDDGEVPDPIHCLAIAQTRTPTDPIELQSLPDISVQEPFLKNLSQTYGEHLVSVIAYPRASASRNGKPIVIGPARVIWPLNNRVQIDTLPAEDPGERREPPGRAAIQQYLATENPPRARLRLNLNGGAGSGKFTPTRLSLVHVMHQRRLYERLSQLRAQSRAKVTVEALALKDIRNWLGDVHIAAVEADDSIVVVNLGEQLESSDNPDAEFIATVGRGGTYIDVEFCCAVIGDEVGIASTIAAEGDFQVTPADPGGNPKIRLFRLQHDRLEPRAIDGSDKIFRDILTRVTSAEIGFRSQGQSITVEGEPWAELLALVGLPSNTDRIRTLQSNPIGVLLLAAWTKMLQGRRPDPQTAMSEFNEYRQAPSFVSALSWHPRLSERAGNLEGALMKADADLPRRIALALGEPDVLGVQVTRDNWGEIWRALTEPSLIHQLIDARIRIDHAPADIRRVRETASEFHDERRVRLALECCLDREMSEEAEALEAYLDNRDRDAWTPLSALMGLQRTVQELVEDPIETPDEEPVSQLEGTDARSFDEMLTTIRRMIAEAQATAPVNGAIKAIARDFEQRLKSKRLDRRLLRQFEQRLTKIVGAPRNDDLARELTNRLEAWADLPNFAEMMRPRFRVLSDNSARKLDIIEALVNRIRLPAPRTAGYEFDRLRKHLSTCIQQRFAAARLTPSQDSKQMADDIAGYADILLHHRAWMALKQLVDKSQSAKDAADLHRFDQSIAVWPLQAAETWEMGRLISKEQFGNDDFLRKTLTPPDF